MTEEIQQNKSNPFWVLVWDRLLDTFDKLSGTIISQCTSGRWILTVAAASVMVYVCVKDITYVKEFKEIIAVIIYAYFQRGDRGQEKEKLNEKPTQ